MTGATPSIGHRRLRRPSSNGGTFANSAAGGEVLGRGLTFEQLEDNCTKNAEIASMIQMADPERAERLSKCCRYIQERRDNLGRIKWQASRYCRLYRWCATCQAIRGRIIADKYKNSVDTYAKQIGAKTSLHSYALHMRPSTSRAATKTLHTCMETIMHLGKIAGPGRRRVNASQQTPPFGPMILSTHYEPASVYRYGLRELENPESVHLHILVTVPASLAVRDTRQHIEKWVEQAANKTVGMADYTLTKQRLPKQVDEEHKADLVAYASKPSKAKWSAKQFLQAAVDLQQDAEWVPLRMLGCEGELGDMPHRVPLTGSVYRFCEVTRMYSAMRADTWVS